MKSPPIISSYCDRSFSSLSRIPNLSYFSRFDTSFNTLLTKKYLYTLMIISEILVWPFICPRFCQDDISILNQYLLKRAFCKIALFIICWQSYLSSKPHSNTPISSLISYLLIYKLKLFIFRFVLFSQIIKLSLIIKYHF